MLNVLFDRPTDDGVAFFIVIVREAGLGPMAYTAMANTAMVILSWYVGSVVEKERIRTPR